MTGHAERPPESQAERRRAVRAWCLYDVANSAFATSVVAAILPPFFAEIASRSMPPHMATAAWAYGSAVALMLAAIAGPVAGAIGDQMGRRKGMLAVCVTIGASATLLLALLAGSGWLTLILLFGVAFVAFATGNALYDSLLPAVAGPDELHAISARGFAWGYFGGGVLLAVNLAWILMPQRFGLADANEAIRLSFASVAVWWGAFSIPLFRHVREPRPRHATGRGIRAAGAALSRIARTLRRIRTQPELLTFLAAFWLYSDGIGTVIKMATVYGSEVGIDRNHLIGALLLVQLLAAPASILFSRMVHPLGPQRAVVIGLAGYVVITLLGFFMKSAWHFWAIATLVALVQGGTQSLSRSMFASLVPRAQLGELFGFYSVSEKLAGVVGPLIFGLVAQLSGAGRFAVLTLLPFFVVGAWLLLRVDLARGGARARLAERRAAGHVERRGSAAV
jgi:UMF1 family MFS transporter